MLSIAFQQNYHSQYFSAISAPAVIAAASVDCSIRAAVTAAATASVITVT